jgi:hypothetical protein
MVSDWLKWKVGARDAFGSIVQPRNQPVKGQGCVYLLFLYFFAAILSYLKESFAQYLFVSEIGPCICPALSQRVAFGAALARVQTR